MTIRIPLHGDGEILFRRDGIGISVSARTFDGAETFLTLDRVRVIIGALAEMCSPTRPEDGRWGLLEPD